MKEVRDLNNKRVCDISDDRKRIEIVCDDCITIVSVNRDGRLNTEFARIQKPKKQRMYGRK